MKKCPFCKKEYNPAEGIHAYRCAKKNNITLEKKEIRYECIKYNFPELADKIILINEYQNNKMSFPDFNKKYGIDSKSVYFLLDYFDIPKRSISESAKLISAEKHKKTCLERYGVENISQVQKIKEQKKKTFLKNYGVDNIWKNKDYQQWLIDYMFDTYGKGSLSNKNKNLNRYWKNLPEELKDIRLKKLHDGYKKYWDNLSDEQKDILIQKQTKKFVFNSKSKLEIRVQTILSLMGIEIHTQFFIKRKSYDIKICKSKILIEVQGDFWHANPNIYGENDVLIFPNENILAKDVWKKDLNKKQIAESFGYKLIYLWESDLNKINDEQLAKFLFEMLIDKIDG